MVQDISGQISVRVDEAHAIPVVDVRDDHVLDEGGFARAGLADGIHVSPAILLLDAEDGSSVPVVGHGEVGDGILIVPVAVHSSHRVAVALSEKRVITAILGKLMFLL